MRVTVGISFFNNETTLADAIRSVFAQTFQDWELILIDDGSTDGSLAIAQSVRDSRVSVISDGENRGVPYRLNQITELARGEYIARMDGDDIMHPERLALQVEYLDTHPDTDIVSNGLYIIDGENKLIGVRCIEPLDSSPANALARGILVQGSAMGRTAWWHKFPYDATYVRAEENELWCRSCKASTFGKILRPLYFCREHSKPPKQFLKGSLQSLHTLRRIYRGYGPSFIGWPRTVVMIGKAYLKGEIYRVATYLGLLPRIIDRRNKELAAQERAEAEVALRVVMQTYVPGIDIVTDLDNQSEYSHIQAREHLGLQIARLVYEAQLSDKNPSECQKKLRLCRIVTAPTTFVSLLHSQMRTIASNNIDCTLVSSPGEELDMMSRDLGLRCHAIDMSREINLIKDIKSLYRLYKFFKSERFDIVHSSTAKAGLLTAVAARLARVPLRIHTYTGQRWVELCGVRRWVVRLCDRIIAVLNTHCYADSRSQMVFLIGEGLIKPSKISVPASGSISGVDLNRFNPDKWKSSDALAVRQELGIDEDAIMILFVGRVNRDKGIIELIHAFKSLDVAGKKTELVLVGSFEPKLDPLPGAIIDALMTNPNIHIVGQTREPERYMGAADILCLPSYREGFGSVVIEAAAMGVPAVATSIVGLVDAVDDGKTGLLVSPKDVGSLRRALSTMILKSDLRERMGQAARERAERLFDARIVNQAVVDEYKRLFGLLGGDSEIATSNWNRISESGIRTEGGDPAEASGKDSEIPTQDTPEQDNEEAA